MLKPCKSETSEARFGLKKVGFVTTFVFVWITLSMAQGESSISVKGKLQNQFDTYWYILYIYTHISTLVDCDKLFFLTWARCREIFCVLYFQIKIVIRVFVTLYRYVCVAYTYYR